MQPVTRQEVLGLYRKIFRIAKKWQAASGQMEETMKEKEYIINEAKTLFQKNKNLTDPELIKQCIEECKARVEIGLHYHIPYPRPKLSDFKKVPTEQAFDLGCIRAAVLRIDQWQFKSDQIRGSPDLELNAEEIHLPPMGLAQQQGRAFRHQEKLRKLSKPLYLKSHDEVS